MSTKPIPLDDFPSIRKLKKAYEETFVANNPFIEHFLPHKQQIIFDGLHKRLIKLSSDERFKIAKDSLLSDNTGYFDELVHNSHLRDDVTEVIRTLFNEFSKNDA